MRVRADPLVDGCKTEGFGGTSRRTHTEPHFDMGWGGWGARRPGREAVEAGDGRLQCASSAASIRSMPQRGALNSLLLAVRRLAPLFSEVALAGSRGVLRSSVHTSLTQACSAPLQSRRADRHVEGEGRPEDSTERHLVLAPRSTLLANAPGASLSSPAPSLARAPRPPRSSY